MTTDSPIFRSSSTLIAKIISSLLLFAALASLAGAQTVDSGSKPEVTKSLDPAKLSAIDLAKRVDDHYNRLRSLKASFTEQYDGLGMSRHESGTMLLRKPGRMRWEYQSTPGKLFVLDGKYAWFYAPGDTQVQRIAASQLDDLRSPLRFLLGHTKIESELEQLKITMYQQMSRSSTITLTGIPKGQKKRIAKLSLEVNQDGAIIGISIQEVDGSQTEFNFSNEEPNAVAPDSAFRFTAPNGVPVVDALPPV